MKLVAITCCTAFACGSDDQLSDPVDRDPFEVCDDEEQSIRTDFERWQACAEDDDCVISKFDLQCVSPFLCGTSHAKSSDRAALERDIEKLVARYKTKCECSLADCGPIETLTPRCNLSTHLCASE